MDNANVDTFNIYKSIDIRKFLAEIHESLYIWFEIQESLVTEI